MDRRGTSSVSYLAYETDADDSVYPVGKTRILCAHCKTEVRDAPGLQKHWELQNECKIQSLHGE